MKKIWLISGLILAAILLPSCPTPLDIIGQIEDEDAITEEPHPPQEAPPEAEVSEEEGESTEPAAPAIEPFTPGIGTDTERNQGVFINKKNEMIDIISMEDGVPIACVKTVDMVLLESPDTRAPEEEEPTRAVALVIGERDDGKPGLWEVHGDSSIHPVKVEGRKTSALPESIDYQDWMMYALGWEYHVTGISSDGRIIIGYAENSGGWEHSHWNIEEGTTVGIYWYLGKNTSGRIQWVSRARVIGTPLKTFNHRFGPDKFGRRARQWLRLL